MADTPFRLQLLLDSATGQLIHLRHPASQVPILEFAEGPELEINGVPLHTTLIHEDQREFEHITTLHATFSSAYGAGVNFRVRRVITASGNRNHAGPVDAYHIRYEFTRIPNTDHKPTIDFIWQPELEAPLRIERIGTLCADSKWFGPSTRMRAIAIGGSGPREHVSIEDGPIAQVLPQLQTAFRSCFPGQPTIAGALYYEPSEENFTWMCVRRSPTGGRLRFESTRHGFDFFYFQESQLQSEIVTPAISLFPGQGLQNAERILAQQFDRFAEPPEWWFNSTWFWLHPLWQSGGTYETMAQGAEILNEQCGVNGFGLCVHDVPWSGHDIDVGDFLPSPYLGGDDGLRRAVERISAKNAHTYIWLSRTAHRPDNTTYNRNWGLQGIDGRPVRLRNNADSGVFIDVVNSLDPAFEDHMHKVIEYYVKVLGITGFFWDSAFQPLPPDFGNKPYLKNPGEAMAGYLPFYERIYRFGRSLSKDFFMWGEGITVDAPMNAFAVDGRSHHGASGHRLMHRLAHAGPKRLVWRSAWAHDLASAFPFISPASDINAHPRPDTYKQIAADPMNRWVSSIVRERGTRRAVGIAEGVSILDDYVVASPQISGEIAIPSSISDSRLLKNVHTGALVKGTPTTCCTKFNLPESGAYQLQK